MTLPSISTSQAFFDRVLEDLAQGPAVAAADDQDVLRTRVGRQGRMDEHLVIVELVPLGRLDEAVEKKDAPVVLIADDLDPLELRPPLVEDLLHGKKNAGRRGLIFAGLGLFGIESSCDAHGFSSFPDLIIA